MRGAVGGLRYYSYRNKIIKYIGALGVPGDAFGVFDDLVKVGLAFDVGRKEREGRGEWGRGV